MDSFSLQVPLAFRLGVEDAAIDQLLAIRTHGQFQG